MKRLVAILAVAATTTALAQVAPRTVQQDFDAATALSAGPDRAAALAAWQALEKRVAGNRRTHAIVLVRKSAVLVALGRKDEAVAAARAGLADLPSGDATLRDDRQQAYLNLGLIAEQSIDYASAADAYAEAETLAEAPVDKLSAQLGLIRTDTFIDPPAAAQAAARADALIASVKTAKGAMGQLADTKAVMLLNRGDIAGARTMSMSAVKLLGGLTEQTDLRDVSARSTAAIASLLAGKPGEARQYMAMSGAGRLSRGSFDPAVQMQVPECGGDAGLKPADVAVVQFSIGNDGSVIAVSPIYAAGGGQVALAFARAAHDWSWTPEQVKAMPAFFRYNARVEMRCSTEFERPSIARLVRGEVADWLTSKGVALADPSNGADAARLAGDRAALAAADARDSSGPASFAALYRLTENQVVGRDDRHAYAVRAAAIAAAAGAPPMVRMDLAITLRQTDHAEGRRDRGFRTTMAALLTDPLYANDPQARSMLRLLLADASKSPDDQLVLLRQVADDKALVVNDPLRVGALIRVASIEARQGRDEAARQAYEQSGLAPNQCALIDSPPKFLSAGGSFPSEAMQWGFEGWTRTQFDVAADGKVVNQRAVLSYPPFIFTKAGVATMAGARYAKSYRPNGGIGCGGITQNVRFVMGQ